MDNFRFCSPTYFDFGKGTENDAGELVFELDGGNISFTLNDEFVKDLKTKTK